MNNFLKSIVLAAVSVPVPVFAYLDPGTGSMLLQVILGGVAAVAVALKLFWYRIIAFLGFRKKAPGEDSAD